MLALSLSLELVYLHPNSTRKSSKSLDAAHALIGIVPLVNTKQNLDMNPCGENEDTVGLTPKRLLDDLWDMSRNDRPAFLEHWHSNPCKMLDADMKLLPRTVLVFAKLNILYPSQTELEGRLRGAGVDLECLKVYGVHQVKGYTIYGS